MNLFVAILLICANIQHVFNSVEYSPIVQLKSGKVQGLVQETRLLGHKVYLYEGIRYGRAERFSVAKPVESWSDVYNATKWRDACPQTGIEKAPQIFPYSTETMSEDCLFLSVWKPALDQSKPRPVMVWIHGGGYTVGTIFSSIYDCRYIAAQDDVIVVSINYRLGAFGFLFGGTIDAPGNIGFHDQILALHWVKDNIVHFGGDPNQVTVFGESAGSMAVGSLILSPLTKGLFKRAIMQSGGPNSIYGKMNQTESLHYTHELVKSLGCHSNSTKESIDCLRHNRTIDQILSFATLPNVDKGIDRIFKPIYGDEVLSLKPEDALKTGKFNQDLDLLFGTTSNEGSFLVYYMVSDIFQDKTFTLNSTQEIIKNLFKGEMFSSEVAVFYTENLNANSSQNQLKKSISNAFGDFFLTCPTILFGEQFGRHSSQHSIYSYRLTRPSHNPIVVNCTDWMTVCHGEDLSYLFMLPSIEHDPKLVQLSSDIIHAWTEFAKFGKPGKMGHVEWEKAYDQNLVHNQHMNLDPDDYRMVSDFYKDTCDAFWKKRILN